MGILDLMAFEPEHLRAEVGIVVLPSYQRQGLAATAIRLLADYCRTKLHLHQLYAWVALDNEPSLKLFRSLGFSSSTVIKEWLFNGREYKDVVLMQFFL